jgi:hypothetical protein
MADVLDIPEPKGPKISVEIKNKGGRPKNKNYLPWEECRQIIRDEMIPSKGKFEEWHDRNKPKVIPRFPYRVYTEEWVSWNDFLGNENKFNERIGTKWQTLAEAARYVHTLKLNSAAEWLEHCRGGTLPDNIPKRPELTYADWISWGHFLGNKPAEVVEAIKESQKVQVYFITHEIGVPENVLTFGVEPMGVAGMKDRYSRGDIHIVKMFWYSADKGAIIKQVVESLSTEYMGTRNQRIVPNVYQIIEFLQYHLDTITKV